VRGVVQRTIQRLTSHKAGESCYEYSLLENNTDNNSRAVVSTSVTDDGDSIL